MSFSESKTPTILFLAATPQDQNALKTIQECNKIDDLIGDSSKMNFQQRHAVTFASLRKKLIKLKPQIIHFSGHGSNAGHLVFEDENQNSVTISREVIADLFSILRDDILCVILNACYSENQANLISKSIPYVIGMNDAITDKAAINFSVTFYESFSNGISIPQSFALAVNSLAENYPKEQKIPKLLYNDSFPNQTFSTQDNTRIQNYSNFYQKLYSLDKKTFQIFKQQIHPRNELYDSLSHRYDVKRYEDFEEMFTDLYPQFTEDEKFKAETIWELTNQQAKYNSKILKILDDNDELFDDLPMLQDLHDHLNLWVAKYNASKKRDDKFLIYVGVQEKKPYPSLISKLLETKIKEFTNPINDN